MLEEWRLDQKKDIGVRNSIEQLALKGSRYDRTDITGDTACINHFNIQDLQKFINKWYRPDHLTIVAIGGFDTAKMENKIKQIFSTVPVRSDKSPRIEYPVNDIKEPVIVIDSDNDLSSGKINIYYKHNKPKLYTQQELRKYFIDFLISYMVENRMNQIITNSNTSITKARASFEEVYFGTNNYNEFHINLNVKNEQFKQALKLAFLENERILKHGFTESELQRSKDRLMKIYSKENEKRIQLPYDEYYIVCYYYILQGRPNPSFSYKCDFVSQTVTGISLQEINSRYKEYTNEIFPIISISTPKITDTTISVSEIKNIYVATPHIKVEPYTDKFANRTLFDKKITPGKIVTESFNKELGTTEWILSNGMHIILKPTDFKKDEIRFKSFNNKIDTFRLLKDYLSTLVCGRLSINEMGVGDFPKYQLDQMLIGKKVSVQPLISLFGEGIDGNSYSQDLETALQLIHLYFTDPRLDENILMQKAELLQAGKDRISSSTAFNDTVSKYVRIDQDSNNLAANYKIISIEKLKKIYRKIYSKPGEFTFFFAGDFKPEVVRLPIEKYLGSLQNANDEINGITEAIKKTVPWYKTGKKSCIFTYPMKVPATKIVVCCQGKTKNALLYGNLTEDLLIQQIARIVREKFGATYNVGPYVTTTGKDFWQGSVYFQTNPQKTDQMVSVVREEVRKFMKGEINETDFGIAKNIIVKQRTADLQSNAWWVNNALHEYYNHNKNIIPDYQQEAKNLTIQGLQEFTKSIYEQGNIIEIVMKPQ